MGAVGDSEPLYMGFPAIQSKAGTLRLLHLDDRDGGEYELFAAPGRSLQEFETLCSKCSEMEQLAICAPTWTEGMSEGDAQAFSAFLVRKPKRVDPFFRSADSRGTDKEVTLRYEMQLLADKVFEKLKDDCPRFSALMLDVRGNEDNCASLPLQYGYLRGTRMDRYGRSVAEGIPINSHLIKHHEPRSDILEE
ncbi:hypothetical protein LTR85_000601 [Meristemomyces frigidus]|nr:hypothetical protein LTR85_000601 [Meristemomyces frigidus]